MGDHDVEPGFDDIDQRLTERGARWRAALPSAAEPDLRFQEQRHPGWMRRVPALAALATAVIVAGVWAVGGHESGRPQPAPETPPPGDVVPWAALPPTDPALPTSGGGPSTQEIAAARPCAGGDLRVLRRDVDGAGGTAFVIVRLALDGATPCRVEGDPEVFPLGPAGQVLDVDVQNEDEREPRLVTTDAPVAVVVSWAVSHYCGPLDNQRLRIAIPDNAGEVTVAGFGQTSCNPGEGQPAMAVRLVQPAYDEPPRSPYENVTVTGDLDLAVGVGAGIDFEVTLTSPVDLPLEPCPDYQILLGPRVEYYALNCAAVPYVDREGRPYLPARVPVTFAMQANGYDQATYFTKFGWILTAPGHPTATGTVEIGDAAPPDGTVTGLVTMDGGPAPGTSIKVTEGEVHVVGSDTAGSDIDRTVPIQGGQFEVSVPPGTYRVWATTPQYNDGEAECPVARDPDGNFPAGAKILIDAGEVMQVRLRCVMR